MTNKTLKKIVAEDERGQKYIAADLGLGMSQFRKYLYGSIPIPDQSHILRKLKKSCIIVMGDDYES